MKKILILGQAPAAVKQAVPYDTTMLYQWLEACGVSKQAAQELFIFEAVANTFPGFSHAGGHNKPTMEDIKAHWPVIEAHLQDIDKVIILGGVAAQVYESMPRTWSCNVQELYLIHPSKRNTDRFNQNREAILKSLKDFIGYPSTDPVSLENDEMEEYHSPEPEQNFGDN